MARDLNERLLMKAYRSRRYRGKQVMIVGGKIFSAGTGRQAVKLFHRITKAYPQQSPLITYIPKADSLILWVL